MDEDIICRDGRCFRITPGEIRRTVGRGTLRDEIEAELLTDALR